MQRKRMLAGGVLAAAAIGLASPAFGVSPSQAECEAAGGTFTRTQGVVDCVFVDPGKNPKFS